MLVNKVALICGAGLVSGKEIMTLELANGLRDKGCSVELITSSWGSGDFRERCKRLGFPAHVMRLGFISATLDWKWLFMTGHQIVHWPWLVMSYYRFLKTSNPRTVVHTNWHHLLLLSPFLRPDRDVFWLHEVMPNKPQYRKVFGWVAKRVSFFVPVSNAVGDSLRRIGIPENKIRLIYNGIIDPAAARQPSGRKSSQVIIGIVGQIGRWKGHEDLLEAFSVVAISSPTVQLHIFGQGDRGYENLLKQKAVFLGIADRIIWRGFLAQRIQIYEQMDICVVPTRSEEPLSTVAIEAAFFGIPIIATRKGGFAEIVEHGITGFLVDANEPVQLASRMQILIDDQQLRHEMGKNARHVALRRFNRERFIQDFYDTLQVTNSKSEGCSLKH